MGMTDRDLENLEKRVLELERRTNANVASLNGILQKAKDCDSALSKRLDKAEQELSKVNTSQRGSDSAFTKAQATALIDAGDGICTGLLKAAERDLTTQINNLRKQVDNLAKNAKR